MRYLLIHSDYLRFEVKKKAVSSAEDFPEKVGSVDDVLVVFMAVEGGDESNFESVVGQAVEDILDTREKVKAASIAVYPYAHLSSTLSTPDFAKKILNEVYHKLKEKYSGGQVIKAPFGWYKSFELKCKGHPLSELSREIKPAAVAGKEAAPEHPPAEKKAGEEVVSEAVKSEEKLESQWYIMTPEDGELIELNKFNFGGRHDNLKKFAKYETQKVRAVDQTPPHVTLMRGMELVDYEPGSDSGNMRYYPKGRLIKSLLEDYVTMRVIDYGGVEVESPIMYDFEHPTLAKYLNRFPARQYTVESEKKKFFLRFAACFGQFLIAHDATISYKNLPLKLYELTKYSFRREKSGELTGLRRLRAFTMPDVHALCEDLEQAMSEYKIRFSLCKSVLEKIGFTTDDFEFAVRVTREFYNEHKEFVQYLVKSFGKPALVEVWDKRPFYFVLKYEFNFVDALDKASALATDQIDIENGERYDIKFTSSSGERKHPIILHCSPSGAIERVIYALLEKAYMDMKAGKTPKLPLWLSPTQVRVIPLSENFLDYSQGVLMELDSAGIRADLDDRSESMGRKIREAEKEWISYILVVGEKEKSSGVFQVRVRGVKEQKDMALKELIKEIRSETEGMPYKPMSLPKELSRRPIFVG